MFCRNCGKQLNDGQRFCPNCGQPQQAAPAPVQPVAPAPVQPVAPAPVQPVAPAPVQPVAPAPVQPVAPAPVQPVAPAPVQPVAPAPVQPVAPTPVQPVAPAPVQPEATAPVQPEATAEPVYVPASQQPKQETYIPASQQPKQETYAPVQPEAEPQPVAQQPVEQQPVFPAPDAFQLPKQEPVAQPAPAFAVSSPTSAKPVKKKGKGGKIALIIVAVLLVAAIALAAFNWDSIVRFVKRTTMDPTDYAVEVEKKAAADVAKQFANAYDQAMQNADISDMSSQTKTTLQLDDSVISVVEELLAQEGMDMDLSWIDDISLDTDMNMKDGKMSADIAVGLNGSHLLTLSAAWDLETQIMWIGIPELSDAYLEMDMEEVLGEDTSDMLLTFMEAQELYAQMAEALPSGAELESMINKYVGIVFDHMKDVEKANETVKLDGLKQDMLVMTTEFSQKDYLNILKALMEEARNDQTVKDLLAAMAEIIGEDADELFGYYTDAIDETLAELDSLLEEATNEKVISLETFLDSQDNIVGRTITLVMEGEKSSLSYITVTQGDKFAFEADLASAAIITGSGTIKDGKTSGEYVLAIMGEEYLTLKVENYYTTESGTFSGTFVLSPESAMMEELGMDSSMLQMIGSNVGFKFSLDTTTDTPSASFGILAASMELFSIDVSGKTGKAGSISLPEVTVDVNDDIAAITWLAGLDLDALLSNLEKAGVPSEYMDIASMIAELFAAEFQ